MQTTVEITEAHPTSCSDENKLASPTGQGTSHLPDSQPSPGSEEGPTFKPKAERRSPSGKGFFKRKLPLWLKRKGPANSPQGLVVSQSRLCMEATHESPIQAVRKPTQRGGFSFDTKEGSTQQNTGGPLLRKLWCLKATNSTLKKPPLGLEASPLQRARCGPVATLSRTADPHGESPLRWKPRAEMQSPEEVGSFAEPEKAETVRQRYASWLTKPWRTFRSTMATRGKKGPFSSGSERNLGATGEKVLSLPAELETSPATRANRPLRDQQDEAAAGGDKTPPTTPPSVVDDFCGSREDEGANGTPQRRLESHRRMEAISNPVPKLPVREENGCCEDNPILAAVSELEAIQAEIRYLPGGRKPEAGGAGTEDEGPEQGDNGYWPELSAGEDLAELAENPGGQGMVMATRGWPTCEGLGGPKPGGKAAVSTRSDSDTQGTVVSADRPGEIQHSDKRASGVTPDKTSRANCFFPPALSENNTSSVATSHRSGTATLEEVGPSWVLERGAEGSLTSKPVRTAALDPPGENSASPGMGQPLPNLTEPHGASPRPGTTGPEENQKRLIYVAAVEIVEAAIDAAAEQLAKKKEQEEAGLRGQAGAKADPLARAATQ